MQRRAYAPGLAALLAALAVVTGLGGCSAGAGTDGADADAKSGTTTGPVAAPGRYRTLYEPCGSVSASLLQELLPGVADLPAEQRERVLRGTAAVSYDTDRRAGCSWKADGVDAVHHLTLDFERVVSYDPTVSDDSRAQEVFERKETAAGLPARTPEPGSASPSGASAPGASAPGASASGGSPSGSSAATPPAGGQQAQTGTPSPGASGSPAAPPASPDASVSATPDGLQPRVLDDLADAAFIDDVLAPAGPAAQQRTVSVVFRTSNVIVTVRYAAQPARVGEVPDSEELQDRARALARSLADRFDD
ncbi:DUF3558 domain-containing protein [Streptomyces sp. TRM64462]|uniref:DUF3558 domain-containing protein n=1 Tax=Streptomyces sp. TRM64462 TaxID=2741726 RepID=UPI00158630FE|nr:DUF3558 domain-containing protein [Streptomyces sp. TRM64462]